MFQIYNGGTTFKQWSKGNKLVMDVLPVGADVLFYSDSYSDAPLKSDVYEITVDDETIKVCDVPNALLTKTEKIKVCIRSIVTGKYGVDHSMVGPREKYFTVEPADKPSDYVEDPVDTGGGLTKLPEGYPYKEKVFEDIVWDGDTEGRVAIEGMGCYKVSEITPSIEQLVGATLVTYLPQSDATKDYVLTADYFMEVAPGLFGLSDGFVMVATAPVSMDGLEIKEAGLYFSDGSAERSYKLLMPEVIHPMAPEFLPAGVGGGVQVVTLTGDDSDGSMVYTSSHTGAEIAEMARNGAVIANLVTPDGGNNIAAYAGSYMGTSSFIAALVAGGKAAINAFVVSENDTTVTGGIMS